MQAGAALLRMKSEGRVTEPSSSPTKLLRVHYRLPTGKKNKASKLNPTTRPLHGLGNQCRQFRRGLLLGRRSLKKHGRP